MSPPDLESTENSTMLIGIVPAEPAEPAEQHISLHCLHLFLQKIKIIYVPHQTKTVTS